MLSSIKSKVIILTLTLLCAFGFVVTGATLVAFYKDKELIIEGNKASITAFEKQLNTEIIKLEQNAQDLALMGEIYFDHCRKRQGKVVKYDGIRRKETVGKYFRRIPHVNHQELCNCNCSSGCKCCYADCFDVVELSKPHHYLVGLENQE